LKRLIPLLGLAAVLIWGASGCAAAGEADVSTSEVPPADPSLGDAWVRPADGTVMVYVPGGTFQMGSDEDDPDADDDEFPQHPVTLDGFWIDRTEVTNAQFAAFLNARGDRAENGARYIELNQGYCRIEQADGEYRSRPAAADYAVVMVSWYAANDYCAWVGGRLPTEAEWEYAARGPEGHIYPWGDDAPTCERAQFVTCATCAMAVGDLPDGASWCGALDMAGNVWEWVADRYGEYPPDPQENPTGPSSGVLRVARGGGWHASKKEIRTAFRLESGPSSYVGCIGFRCAVQP
jgi:formylglycine-generating enzyme required for sulfatase activity